MQYQAQDAARRHRGVGGQLSRSSTSGWGKATSRLFSSAATTAAPTPVAGLPDSSFCEMPDVNDSTSTSITSSPSPRMRGSPDSARVEEAPNSHIARWIGGRSSNNPRSNNGGNEPMTDASADIWGRGIMANGGASTGRELTKRSVRFRIFVVFRGGWCTSSADLLQGFVNINPKIKLAGGKVIALSSQTPAQVQSAVRDMGLPFEAFGDPSNGMIVEMNSRFGMCCTVNQNEMVTGAYPNGMAQPCVLAVYGDEIQNEESVLYRYTQWQTIGTLQHEKVLGEIVRSLARKESPRQPPAGGGAGRFPPRPRYPPRYSERVSSSLEPVVEPQAAVAVPPSAVSGDVVSRTRDARVLTPPASVFSRAGSPSPSLRSHSPSIDEAVDEALAARRRGASGARRGKAEEVVRTAAGGGGGIRRGGVPSRGMSSRLGTASQGVGVERMAPYGGRAEVAGGGAGGGGGAPVSGELTLWEGNGVSAGEKGAASGGVPVREDRTAGHTPLRSRRAQPVFGEPAPRAEVNGGGGEEHEAPSANLVRLRGRDAGNGSNAEAKRQEFGNLKRNPSSWVRWTLGQSIRGQASFADPVTDVNNLGGGAGGGGKGRRDGSSAAGISVDSAAHTGSTKWSLRNWQR